MSLRGAAVPGERRTTDAGSIGDLSPWYHDRRLAREAGFKDRLAPPLFGFVLVEGLKYCLAPDRGVGIPMASLAWRWRHQGALLVGATVDLGVDIQGKRASRSKHDRGVIAQALSLEDSTGAAIQSGQHLQMFRRRPAAAGLRDRRTGLISGASARQAIGGPPDPAPT